MSVKYKRTDETDDGLIRWYSVDDETYGLDTDGVILGSDGLLLADDVERRHTLRQIAKFEAFK